MKKTISMMSEEFENEQTGEKVEGITIMIDGFFKDFLYILKEKNPQYQTNLDLINDALMKGLDLIRKETNPSCISSDLI